MSPPDRSPTRWVALLREQRYRRHFLREDGRQTSVVMAVVAACFGAGVGNDFLLLGGRDLLLGIALSSRVLHVVATVIALVLIRRARWPRQMDRAFLFGHIGIALVVAGTELTRIPSGRFQGSLIASSAVLVLVCFAERGPLGARAILGVGCTIPPIILLLLPHAAIDPAARPVGVLALVGLSVVGIFSARSFEQQRRSRFEAERRERQVRQELETKLRELAVEKERAEVMAHARAAFLAAMSHEFRTPMNAVIGLSDLVLDSPLSLETRTHVRTINDSARALLGLLEDILDFAKIDAQKLTLSHAPFNLHRLAASVTDMLRPTASARSVELSLEYGSEVPEYVVGDDARLRQVLVNLVSNAVKFTDRGTVRVGLAASRAHEAHPHELEFRVEDTGTGIAPDVLSRLFRPFVQADTSITRRHGGTGLGLAVSKQIVAAMGGDIHVESEPGRGSVFSFTLRLMAAAPPETAATVGAVAYPADRPPLAILVVDDHPINREVARAILARLGYQTDLASDGGEALEAIAKKDYDVVLMDLQMPGMSGIEATARIGEATAGQRGPHVIAMTASLFEEDREACRRAGMYDFVGKPIELAQLDAVLTRVAEARGAAVPSLSSEPIARLRRIESLGEPRYFESLCRFFFDDTQRRLLRMKEALGRGDAVELDREAHTLKSTSATLGAIKMSEICAKVEDAARQGRMEGLGAAIDALAAEFVEVERALAQELEGGPRHFGVEAS